MSCFSRMNDAVDRWLREVFGFLEEEDWEDF